MDVAWDAGGSNSYRMGAEGKFDLMVVRPQDAKDTDPSSSAPSSSGARVKISSAWRDNKKSLTVRQCRLLLK